jgi:hypothetical protein
LKTGVGLGLAIDVQPETLRTPRVTALALRRLWPIGVILLLWVGFFWRVLTPNALDRVTFQQGDFTLQFLAYRQLAFAQLATGHFPTLEDCLYAGHPFLADPQAQLLYPPVLALMGLGRVLGWQSYPLRALEWEVMLHVLLAAGGMFAFLRELQLRRSAALFASTAFAYSGYLTGYAMLQTGILEAGAWLPLMLLCTRRLSRAHGIFTRSGVALAALGAIALFAGHPQTLLFSLYACAIAYCWWSWPLTRMSVLRGSLALLLTLGLSAAQLLPSALFMLNSTRAGLAFEAAGRGFALQDLSLFALTGVTNVWQPLYVGIATLIFAAWALTRRAWRETGLWLLLGASALLLSFGANAFGFDLLYHFAPGYRQFQSQERHAILITLSLAALGAYGIHSIAEVSALRDAWRLRRMSTRLWLAAAVALALLIAVLVAGTLMPALQPRSGPIANRIALLALALTGTGAVLRWRVGLPAKRQTLWLAAAIMILAIDVFTANRSTATQPPAEPFPKLPLIEAITREKRPSAAFERVYNHFGLPLNAACVNGLREVGGGSPIVWREYRTFLDRTPEFVMLRLLNVRFATTWRGAMTTPEGIEVPWFLLARDTFEGKEASTYRLDWEPRETRGAWIAVPVLADSADTLYALMQAPGFDPFAHTPLLAADLATHTGTGSAAVEGRATGYIKIAANADAPALVSVSQAYHPNWQAQVNGRSVTPVPVYGALLGVPIDAGAHTIELSFQPRDLYAGLIISAATALLALILLLADARKKAPVA